MSSCQIFSRSYWITNNIRSFKAKAVLKHIIPEKYFGVINMFINFSVWQSTMYEHPTEWIMYEHPMSVGQKMMSNRNFHEKSLHFC